MNPPTVLSLPVLLRRVVGLSTVAGYVEIIGYKDFNGIYPGIMTGNTVQLGLTFAKVQWERFGTIGLAVALFFVGGIVASLIRWHLRRPPLELLLMAGLLLVAGAVRLDAPLRMAIELPLLAFAMAMQGETIARFGGVSLQTIVVTNNMVKFSDALVGRYLARIGGPPPTAAKAPELKEVLMPGFAWLSYSIGAGAGATVADAFRFPFVIPAMLLVLMVFDLLGTRTGTASAAG